MYFYSASLLDGVAVILGSDTSIDTQLINRFLISPLSHTVEPPNLPYHAYCRMPSHITCTPTNFSRRPQHQFHQRRNHAPLNAAVDPRAQLSQGATVPLHLSELQTRNTHARTTHNPTNPPELQLRTFDRTSTPQTLGYGEPARYERSIRGEGCF